MYFASAHHSRAIEDITIEEPEINSNNLLVIFHRHNHVQEVLNRDSYDIEIKKKLRNDVI